MSTVVGKLGIAPGMRVGVDGISVDEARVLLGGYTENVDLQPRGGSPIDQLILAAGSIDDLRRMLQGAWGGVKAGGRLWVWYRKGATRARGASAEIPLHRDTLQATLAEFGLVGVTLVSVDATWSAMRVREL
jgi:hypothetical protein